MKKIVLSVSLILMMLGRSFAQQYMLYNTRTLYDAFENPSQKAFHADSSYQFAFNFFFPTISANGSVDNSTKNSVTSSNVNAYLLMFRVFTDVQHEKEIGFSWQVRNNSRLEIPGSNDRSIALDNIYSDVLDKSYSLSYHQISLVYRRNSIYNQKLGLGIKLSYLSSINDSSSIWPGIRNPGASITLSANLKTRRGWYLIGNLKDVGLIHGSNIIGQKNTTNPTTGKLEALVSRDMNDYRLGLILSKNIFYPGWDLALIHRYNIIGNVFLSASTSYNPDTSFQLGGQFMIKSPNCEFYMGSNQIPDTYNIIKGSKGDRAGISFYLVGPQKVIFNFWG